MSTKVSRDQLASRIHTQLVRDALAASNKGGVLSKAEEGKLERTVLRDAAAELRRGGAAVVRLEPWVDAAAAKVIGALDSIDKPGRGKGIISVAEAREAVATKGDAGFRIGHAFELLTGASLDGGGVVSPKLQRAVEQLVENQGFTVLSGLSADKPTAWVQKKIEDTLGAWGGDLMTSGKIKMGDETVHVATALLPMKRTKLTEMIGFFDSEGRAIARAHIDRDDNSGELQMRSASLKGKTGSVLAAVPGPGATAPPKAWTDALKTEVETKYGNGDDLGPSIKRSALPSKELLAAFEFAERNTPDGVGLERVSFQGRDAYAIHDYSCVSSVALYTPEGKQLFSLTG